MIGEEKLAGWGVGSLMSVSYVMLTSDLPSRSLEKSLGKGAPTQIHLLVFIQQLPVTCGARNQCRLGLSQVPGPMLDTFYSQILEPVWYHQKCLESRRSGTNPGTGTSYQ